jgi:hypothetical protein
VFSLPARAAAAALVLTASVAVFLTLVALHRRARVREQRARALAELNRRGIARVRRDWGALPQPNEEMPPNHPYAADLDVAGTPASLYRLIDVVSGATGRPKLLHWLLDAPPSTDELRERRPAITELASAVDLRDELALLARKASKASPRELEGFLTWAESAQSPPPWLWAARVIPLVTIVTALLAFFRILPWTAPGLSIIAGLLILARYRATLATNLTQALARATGLRAQNQMLHRLAHEQFQSPMLQREQQRAVKGEVALHYLERAMSLLEGQGSLVHAILAPILLWDIHALAWLDRWRSRHGRHLRDCLDALGTIEALAALATLAHDNPRSSFPTLDDDAKCLTATSLAHPLLPEQTRVANDVTLGPPGTLLLVTGSNMSGKSTLLRSIGLNVVLAQAGAPVCADSLTMPLVEPRTSIRLADSLERGVSLFMAELERLKEIVDAARVPDRARPLLYLLDEILHGTNTAERLIAARAVLGHLVQAGAIGAVTTHDLTLAADGALATASRPVHFTEQVASANGHEAPGMTFDYRLRPGLATSTNALKLLALVGLAPADVHAPPGESGRPLIPSTPAPRSPDDSTRS